MKVKVAHIGIYTKDLEKLMAFYIKYFDAISNEKYVNAKGFQSYFLTLGSDVRIEIMTHTDLAIRENIDKTNGVNHIAFSVGTKDNVILLTDRIRNDGYNILSEPRMTGDGYFESVVSDPDGNRIEITE